MAKDIGLEMFVHKADVLRHPRRNFSTDFLENFGGLKYNRRGHFALPPATQPNTFSYSRERS